MKQRFLVVYLLLALCAANVVWGQGLSIELTPNQWATFSPGENITIPQYSNKFPVYVASASLSDGNDYLITHQLNASDSIDVPMGTGLLMKLQQGESSRWFDFNPAETSPEELEQNVLFGTTAEKRTSSLPHNNEASILALNKTTQTFCVVDEDVMFPAFRAYITATVVNGANGAPSFRLVTEEEVATGIEPVDPFESLKPTKFWRDGQLIIRRDGILYDVVGRVVTN
ncbi:MAG: hypothetical protein J6T19_03065 [Paludibacteraceae bacterium]|nr:hypothetical protein [Paludibacteraceae bacterium]